MNYEKKRKRQSGRQDKQEQGLYKIWIDSQHKIHATFVKPRKKPKKPT